MRISDWSSDVCSSDLPSVLPAGSHESHTGLSDRPRADCVVDRRVTRTMDDAASPRDDLGVGTRPCGAVVGGAGRPAKTEIFQRHRVAELAADCPRGRAAGGWCVDKLLGVGEDRKWVGLGKRVCGSLGLGGGFVRKK